MSQESFDDKIGPSHISENVSSLLARNLELGNYEFSDQGSKIELTIISEDFGQHIDVHENKGAKYSRTTSLDVHRQFEDDPEPTIDIFQTIYRDGEKTFRYWHTNMPEIDKKGRYYDPMAETEVTRIIELAKNSKKLKIIRSELL